MLKALLLVPLLPLLGAVTNALLGRRLARRVVEGISCGAVGLSLLCSVLVSSWFVTLPADAGYHSIILYRWLSIGEFQPSFGLRLDPLSMVMTLLISGIGFLVHIYSTGFMKKDEDYSRYFLYLNLFIFFMLTLVLADNLFLLFLGWEGVGLCSYLLIGFWYDVEENARAGRKAFIVTRIGDLGLISAILVIFHAFGSLEYSTILPQAGNLEYDGTLAVLVTLLLLLGAMGKSAQLPLQVWLPDAMRGPTPVSALIHSATMVTAGVYLLARLGPFYQMAPSTQDVVSAIGILTALYGASSAMVQRDIKRVLAYSTISQLGLMFLALGVGAHTSAVFHLLSQAFFKSLLFLVAGCLIMGTGEHDIFKMGSRSPILFWTFLAGALSLASIPGTSGFFSKDAILLASWGSGNPLYWPLVVLASFLTSFYIFRVFFVVFRRPLREAESLPATMKVPTVVLSIFALFWGYTGVEGLDRFLGPVLVFERVAVEKAVEITLTGLATLSTLAGAWAAYTLYVSKKDVPDRLAARWQRLHTFLQGGCSFDRLYGIFLVNPYYRICEYLWRALDIRLIDNTISRMAVFYRKGATLLWRVLDLGLIDNTINRMAALYRTWAILLWEWVDIRVIDGFVNGAAAFTLASSRILRIVQTGLIRDYAIPMVGGVAILVLYYMLR